MDAASLSCVAAAELASVLAVLRRSLRFSTRSSAAPSSASAASIAVADDLLDHPLLLSLKSLRRLLFSTSSHPSLPHPSLLLSPFLSLLRSPDSSTAPTSAALAAVHSLLSLDAFTPDGAALRDVVDSAATAASRPECSEDEEVLMRVLEVLLACFRCRRLSPNEELGDIQVCAAVNTCFRIVHQAGNKSELLQRYSRHAMHQLIRCIFSRLPLLDAAAVDPDDSDEMKTKSTTSEGGAADVDAKLPENGNQNSRSEADGSAAASEPYGIPCMVDIFHFLCSLLNIVDQIGGGGTAFDEDVPLFALRMISSAVELGGPSFRRHPRLLSLIQDDLFRNLLQFGLSPSPLILSAVCSTVLILYHHLRFDLKLQLEAFFSCVILRLAQPQLRFGNAGPASYHQQEVAMECLVDFCRQSSFMAEMYANLDCDITCRNVFEELAHLLSRNAYPINCPLSSMHVLALDGLIAIVHGMAEAAAAATSQEQQQPQVIQLAEYAPFWTVRCTSYSDPEVWVKFVRQRKYIKRRLMIGADHFNRDPKKGLEFLQGTHLLPDKLDPQSVACFFRYTAGLDKNLVGDFLGNHDDFCVQVLHEFANTFDFREMSLDTALRLFLETFRLPGEAQKIERVLVSFSSRYFEQSPHILANKDAALLLSYSLIMLNTDQHNVQVKKKMTEEDFIRNSRQINAGGDLPREFLSELYHSICRNEIKTVPDQPGVGFFEMSPSRWTDLIRKSKTTSPYITVHGGGRTHTLDRDMFGIMSGPTIAAMALVFDHAEQEDALMMCVDGFVAAAKVAAFHRLEDVLDDLVVSLCKFTTLLNAATSPASAAAAATMDEPVTAFGDDTKARVATETLFGIANRYGDFIRTGWRNILDCILRLHKLGLLPARVATDAAADDIDQPLDPIHSKQGPTTLSSFSSSHIPVIGTPRRSSGLMSRFTQLMSLDTDEPRSHPTEQQLAAHQRTLQTIQKCRIDSIFTESKFLQPASLLQLARALTWAGGCRPPKAAAAPDDEDTAVFCLELLIGVAINNRDRIALLWPGVYEHLENIVEMTVMPCPLVEKAVFGLLRICQRLLPIKDGIAADEFLRLLQLLLKLNARVADAYCEGIAGEVSRLLRSNFAGGPHARSPMAWRTLISLLSITALHPEASEVGFDALTFVMSEEGGAHLSPANFEVCIRAARKFADSRVGHMDRSVRALDVMAGTMAFLLRWSNHSPGGTHDDEPDNSIKDMWLRLIQTIREVCTDQREEVRNHAVIALQKCVLGNAVDMLHLPPAVRLQAFDSAIFPAVDELLEISQSHHSHKDYRNADGTLLAAVKLLAAVYLTLLPELYGLSSYCKLWLGVLGRLEKCAKAKARGGKRSERLHEAVPELLRNILEAMKAKGYLAKKNTIGGDSLWELTWLHVSNIAPGLQSEVFPDSGDHTRPPPPPPSVDFEL